MAMPRTNSEEELAEKLCQLILPFVKLQHRDQKAVEIDYRILTISFLQNSHFTSTN